MAEDKGITIDSGTKVTSSVQGWLVFISFLMMAGGFLLGFSSGLDKANARIDSMSERVETIEKDRSARLSLYTDNQIKLENRLTRMETLLLQMNAKLQ